MKRTEENLRDFWDNIKSTNSQIIGDLEEEREKDPEEIFKDIIAKNFPNMGNTHVEEAENPIQDKLKEKHSETHTNQTDQN